MTRVFWGVGHGYGGLRRLSRILDSLVCVDCGYEITNDDSPAALYDSYIDVYNEETDSKDVLVRERRSLVQKTVSGKKRFGEMNGIFSFYIEGLHKVWPSAKFIYMVRDPRDQIRISYNLGTYDTRFYSICVSPKATDQFYHDWGTMDNLEKCSWMWLCVNSVILKQLENVSEELVFKYKFEDFINGRRIQELCDFLKIPRPEEKVISKFISARRPEIIGRIEKILPRWKNMEDGQKEKIYNIVGELATELGYNLKEEREC